MEREHSTAGEADSPAKQTAQKAQQSCFSEHGPHLSGTAIDKLFSTIKLIMETPALEVLKRPFCGTKAVVAVTKICLYVF
jgi:hypothetical protein